MSSMIKVFLSALAFTISTVAAAMEDDLESIPPINSELELARADVPANCCSRGIWRTLACVGAWREFFHQNRAQDRNEVLRDAAMAPIARRAIRATFSCCKRFGMKLLGGITLGGTVPITGYSWYEVIWGAGRTCNSWDPCAAWYVAGAVVVPAIGILVLVDLCGR